MLAVIPLPIKSVIAALAIAAALAAGPAAAQTGDGCQRACGAFGDEPSCRRCIGEKLWKKGGAGQGPVVLDTPPAGVGVDKWLEDRGNEELDRSRRDYRANCIATGEC
jgi:hypothetical protein